MVNLGFIPLEKPIPSPDMSFVRLFNDESIGWQFRGQYAFWTGASADSSKKYKLLERLGNRVARIEHGDGSPVFHKIAAGVPFTIENLMGFWIAFDSDAMWLDVQAPDRQYAVLAAGGTAGKPGGAVVDWTCPKCGSGIARNEIDIPPLAFNKFLIQANAWVEKFNEDPQLRACGNCGGAHPPSYGISQGEAAHVEAGAIGS